MAISGLTKTISGGGVQVVCPKNNTVQQRSDSFLVNQTSSSSKQISISQKADFINTTMQATLKRTFNTPMQEWYYELLYRADWERNPTNPVTINVAVNIFLDGQSVPIVISANHTRTGTQYGLSYGGGTSRVLTFEEALKIKTISLASLNCSGSDVFNITKKDFIKP